MTIEMSPSRPGLSLEDHKGAGERATNTFLKPQATMNKLKDKAQAAANKPDRAPKDPHSDIEDESSYRPHYE